METNDIKETWKAGIERTIKPYPEERLNEMVVNSARKSIKTVYPGTVFRLVIIAVAVFLIVSQFVKEQNATRMYLDMALWPCCPSLISSGNAPHTRCGSIPMECP